MSEMRADISRKSRPGNHWRYEVLGRHGGRADRLQWRIGERKDLPQAAKAFHEPQTGVDIDQRIEPRERGYRNVIGNEPGNTVEIRPRHEMIEYVDDQSRPPRLRSAYEEQNFRR